MGKPQKHGKNQNGALVPLGNAIPYFGGAGYFYDRERSPVIENGAVVWPVTRDFDPCPDGCRFMGSCLTHDQLRRGTRTADFAHVNVGDTPQKIRITVPRWFLEHETEVIELNVHLPHPGTAIGHRFTAEALEFVIRQLLDPNNSVEKIAESVGKDVRTIYRIKDEFIPMPPWPITLCINPTMTCFRIDEIYIPKRGKHRRAYTLLLDATHNSFIGLIPGTSEEAIGPTLAAIRARCNIVSATMDFGDYVPIVRRWFPGIKIIGDKFHLIQRLQEVMDNARKAAADGITARELESLQTWLGNPAAGSVGKQEQKPLLKTMTRTGVASGLEKDLYLFKSYYSRLSSPEQRRIKGWLKQIPALRVPYIFLQRMYLLLYRKDLTTDLATETFWEIVGLLELKAPDEFAQAEFFFRTHKDQIEAYFETHETNSRAEGFNRQIRDRLTISRGLGYQELIRQLIILYSKGAPMCPPGAPETLENLPPFKACTDQHLQASLRHGKHARKSFPLEDPDPQGDLDFDPQGDLVIDRQADLPLE